MHEIEKLKIADGKRLHSAMLRTLSMTVVAEHKDRRLKTSEKQKPVISNLLIRSPLVEAKAKDVHDKDKTLANVNPFWAILKCDTTNTMHNMEIVEHKFIDQGCKVPLSDVQALKIEYSASIPMLVNMVNIAKGEILTLPFTYCSE